MAGWLNNPHASCSDFQIPKTGTWLDILWAWIKASVSNTCLRHYLLSLISLSICLALFSLMTYKYFMVTRNSGRVVKVGNQYKVILVLTFLLAIGWSSLCGWEIYESYHNNWSSVPFNDYFYALAQALIWWTLVAMFCFERWQALSQYTSFLRLCWAIHCTSYSICEGYSIIERLLAKETRLPPTSFYNLLGLFTILGCLSLFAISLSGNTWFSITIEDLREPLLEGHVNSTTDGKKEAVTWYCKAGILSKITFTWVNPLLLIGSRQILQFDDIPNLGPDDSADFVHKRLESNWDLQNGGIKSLTWALVITFWPLFMINGILALAKLCVMYAGPLLIQHFINFAADPSKTWQEGVKLGLILFLAKSIEVLVDHQYNFLSQKLGLSVHAALVASVYRKGLRLTSAACQKHGVGRIVNHMSVDVPEIADAFIRVHDLWVLPIQIGLALAILYSVVGLATLTGLATMVAIMVICTLIAHKLQSYTVKTMACKDARIKVTNEAINNMKIIKLQAWQDKFLQKVKNARVAERRWITKSMYVTAMSIFMLWLSPLAVSVLTFGSCLVLNINLTTGRVFTALSTFRILQDPLRAFPQTMLQVSQALVAMRRLLEYFQGDEVKPESIERLLGGEDYAVIVKGGYFKWDSNSTCPTLRNINLEVKCGTLVAIVGIVGSGKSALLGCILGELEKVVGQVRVSGQLAYVSQSAWIQNGTIQTNILFGKPMNKALYKETLQVCSLQSDLARLPCGDQTEIGERGINLSGGQKQRIQLARALYQEADIYILDDIFSAVDAHTGTKLFKECLQGTLASKTVFLVTHQVEFLHSVDLIMVMRDGEIVQSGRHEELVKLGLDFGALVDAHNQSLEMVETQYGRTDNDDISCASSMSSLNGFHLALSPQTSSPLDAQLQDLGHILHSRKSSEHTLLNSGLSRQTSENLNMNSSKESGSATLVNDEERARGQVTFKIYWAYCTKVFKGGHVVALILIQICWQGLQIASDFWLANSTSTQKTFQPKRFITMYGELAIGSGIFVLIRSLLISLVGLQTAQKFFVEMIESVFDAPMSFFDTTPTGRILSRSSRDQMIVDFNIPFSYGTFLALVFQLIGALYVTIHITWQLLFIIVPLVILYVQYQRYFIASSRELTRLESISDAPIIHHFSETMYGLSTIRAFGHQERFVQTNIQRLNTNLSISFHNRGANEWLGFRLESIGTAILCSSALLLILLPSSLIQPELVGLSLSYGMALNSCLFFMTWAMGTIEQNMIAVERIQQYTTLSSEGPFLIKYQRPTNGWPHWGELAIQGLKMRYRPETPLVLKGITFTIKGGEKLGVVGRTGSGKTSLIHALFRLVEPAGGRILIDGLDISTIGLNDLRSRLNIIPQEPTLFEGTVRSNIDPLEEHQDVDIWEVLEKCQLADTIKQKEEKLDAPVAENGGNWSMGQRQLFCLGRALLKRSRILVLDEATASVDTQTDAILQRIIRMEFAHCTVLSIAHRMPNVMDSDKVLVLDAGHMKEFGAPGVLLENPSSLFSLLVQEYWNRSNCSHDIVEMSSSTCM